MRAESLALVFVAVAACLSGPGPGDEPSSEALPPVPALAFAPPTLLTTEGPGFEPSVDVGPDGTVYVTAARTRRPNEDDRLASFLWYSADAGTTWSELASPQGVHRLMVGEEGDTAVDGAGRLYFVDTYLADNSLSRWSPGPGGPSWDFSRPIQGTGSAVDDRPWLTAHGDGIVYYVSNNGGAAPPPEDLVEGRPEPSINWLHVSDDGGTTWSPGSGFPGGQFCLPAASPADDRALVVVCPDESEEGLTVWRSGDRGASFDVAFRTEAARGFAPLTPGAAVDRGGRGVAAWLDEEMTRSGVQDWSWTGETPGQVKVATELTDASWREQDATPFPGRFSMVYASAGAPGHVALTFYATRDVVVTDATEWHAYALVSTNATSPRPAWSLANLTEAPVAIGLESPGDFFQNALAPDGALHVAFQINRDLRPDEQPAPARGIAADVFHVRQVAGPGVPREGEEA